MSFDSIIAQPSVVRVLERAVKNERLASSYLFEGPSGVGKGLAALSVAQAVLCPENRGRGCGRCETCRRIENANYPDVRVFAPRDEGSRNIQVEFVRNEILPFTQFAPFEGSAAFLIFPEADVSLPVTHPESANVLLKTLEEPRRGVHFILLSERPDRLLPTIRSRCQSVRFSRLPNLVLDRILSDHNVPKVDRPSAIALADGRADRALALAKAGTGQELLERAMRIDRSVESNRPGVLVSLSGEIAKDESLELLLETLSTFYRDVAAVSLGIGREKLAFSESAELVRARAAELSAARAAARVARIRETVDTFERNANRQTSIDALLFDLHAL